MRNIPSTFEEYQEIYKRSIEQPQYFWSEIASDFHWHKKLQSKEAMHDIKTLSSEILQMLHIAYLPPEIYLEDHLDVPRQS